MLRTLVTELTPPVVMRAALKLWRRSRGLGFYTFEGHYASIDATPCGADRYDDDELAWKTVEVARRDIEFIAPHVPLVDTNGQLLLPALVSLLGSQLLGSQLLGSQLTILDFGAGAARGLVAVLKHAPAIERAKLHYVIVETPALCRAFSQSGLGIPAMATIPDSLPGPLIVNAGSSLQYVADFRGSLLKLARLEPQYFVIRQTPVSDQPTYARVQLNIPGKRIAQWVFNRGEFVSEMNSLGYGLIFTVDHDLPFTHENAPGPSQTISMIFQRVGIHLSQ